MSLCAASKRATPVFPIPVGRTTSVFFLVVVSSIVSWYNRGVNPCSMEYSIFWLFICFYEMFVQ